MPVGRCLVNLLKASKRRIPMKALDSRMWKTLLAAPSCSWEHTVHRDKLSTNTLRLRERTDLAKSMEKVKYIVYAFC
jgi:hypothetical protein